MTFNMPPRVDLRRLGVDLDGTIATPCWPEPGIGEPRRWAVAKMIRAWEAGYKIWIYTARPDADYELIENWLKVNELWQYVSGIITGKPLFALIIDDRAINESEESWIPTKKS